ncbi:MAG: hypothetical protein LBM99_00085, partial [Bacillales bacterium]|nr:hypothetical protein [Bacillales bacterium]
MKNVKIGRKSIQKVLDKYQGEALVNFILGPYTYKENITINISSANFIGVEGKTKIIINKKERKKEVLFPASTVLVLGSCITFRNIIIESNYKQNGVSLAVFGDNIFLDNCELISNNKSLLLGPLPKDVVEELNESLQNVNTNYPTTTYVNKSKITGSSDYVIGAGTCFFNECEFNNLKEGFVFETLHNSNNPNGFICNKCFFNELTSNILVRSYSYHVSVFLIECLINKNLRPINYENHFSLNYYEYPYLKTDISEEIDKDDLEYFEFVLNNIKRKS